MERIVGVFLGVCVGILNLACGHSKGSFVQQKWSEIRIFPFGSIREKALRKGIIPPRWDHYEGN